MNQEMNLAQMQPIVYQQLRRSSGHGRIARAYLFEGEKGAGKHEVGIWLAQYLFCTQMKGNLSYGECSSYQRIERKERPGVLVTGPEGRTIEVDQTRRLHTKFSRNGYESRKKVFLIKEAEEANNSVASSLLKFLEEPPEDFLAVSETDAVGRVLPTIQSYCRVLRFQELSKEALIHRLQEEQIPLEKAKPLAFLADSLGKAVEISQDKWSNNAKGLIYQWFVYLQKQDTQALIYVQKELVKSFKEKTQQFTGLSVLMFYYQETQRQAVANGEYGGVKQIDQTIGRILIMEQRLRSNVSFQAVAEQSALYTISQFAAENDDQGGWEWQKQ